MISPNTAGVKKCSCREVEEVKVSYCATLCHHQRQPVRPAEDLVFLPLILYAWPYGGRSRKPLCGWSVACQPPPGRRVAWRDRGHEERDAGKSPNTSAGTHQTPPDGRNRPRDIRRRTSSSISTISYTWVTRNLNCYLAPEDACSWMTNVHLNVASMLKSYYHSKNYSWPFGSWRSCLIPSASLCTPSWVFSSWLFLVQLLSRRSFTILAPFSLNNRDSPASLN